MLIAAYGPFSSLAEPLSQFYFMSPVLRMASLQSTDPEGPVRDANPQRDPERGSILEPTCLESGALARRHNRGRSIRTEMRRTIAAETGPSDALDNLTRRSCALRAYESYQIET